MQPDMLHNFVLLELFLGILAVVVWKDKFKNQRAIVHTDSKGVFFAIHMLSSKSELVIKLLSFLVLHCMRFNIWLKAKHIAGIHNNIAHALSHLQFRKF